MISPKLNLVICFVLNSCVNYVLIWWSTKTFFQGENLAPTSQKENKWNW